MSTGNPEYLTVTEFRKLMNEMSDRLDALTRTIEGDRGLRVGSIRENQEQLEKRLTVIEKLIDRGKWFFAGLGLLNVTQLVTWLINYFEGVP